jgi:hypothetical protein
VAEIGKDIQKGKDFLEKDELVAIPTETVYGLAANALNPIAVAKIFEAKYKEWSALELKDKEKLIAKSLRNAALKYCEREKAKTIGYEFLDLYYYDASVIEAFLPSIISESYEIPTKIKDLNFKPTKGETTDGNNWLVLRSDIATGFYRLSEAKQNILRVRFTTESYEWSEIGKELDTTPDGARMKVQRAIASLIRNLGGWKPQMDEDTPEVVEDESRE